MTDIDRLHLPVAAAVDRFLTDLRIGRAPATVRTYRASLRQFVSFVGDATVAMLTEDHVMDFARHCARAASGLQPVSQPTYSSAVLGFYHWLERERYRPDLDLRALDSRRAALRGRRAKRLVKVPTDATIAAIVDLAHSRLPAATEQASPIDRRDVAIVECLRGSGVRVSELVGMRRRDLIAKDHSARIVGKGDKERLVYFTPAAWAALDAYFAIRPACPKRSLGAQPVFLRHTRGIGDATLPLSTKSVRQIVQKLGSAAGVEEATVTPHGFRRWFASHVIEQTADLAAAQDLLGHESADTTRRYAQITQQRLRQLHERAFE